MFWSSKAWLIVAMASGYGLATAQADDQVGQTSLGATIHILSGPPGWHTAPLQILAGGNHSVASILSVGCSGFIDTYVPGMWIELVQKGSGILEIVPKSQGLIVVEDPAHQWWCSSIAQPVLTPRMQGIYKVWLASPVPMPLGQGDIEAIDYDAAQAATLQRTQAPAVGPTLPVPQEGPAPLEGMSTSARNSLHP